MKREYFNISMNMIGSNILSLEHTQVQDLIEEIKAIEIQLDTFKEECLKKLRFETDE